MPTPAPNVVEVLAKHEGDPLWSKARVAGRIGVSLPTLYLALNGKPLNKSAQRLLYLLDRGEPKNIGDLLDSFSAGLPVEPVKYHREHTGELAEGFHILKTRGVVRSQTDLGKRLGLHQPQVSDMLTGKVEFPEYLQKALRDLLAETAPEFIFEPPTHLPGFLAGKGAKA